MQIDHILRRSQGPMQEHGAIIDSAYDAVLGFTRTGLIKIWNAGATRLFGYSQADMVGKPASILIEKSQNAEHQTLMKKAWAGTRVGPVETKRRHRDGRNIPVELVLVPMEDAEGKVTMVVATIRDITAQKRLESLHAVIVDDLTHRLGNTIATVRALATLSLNGATSLDSFATTFCARLQSLSATHTILTTAAGMRRTLQSLVHAELAPYELSGTQRWKISGDEVSLNARQALAFSMVVHELTTNAVKHGALSDFGGRIDISWKIPTAGGISRLQMMWREAGGPTVTVPTRMGVGRRLLTDVLAAELDGSIMLTFDPSGLRCDIDVPLDSTRQFL